MEGTWWVAKIRINSLQLKKKDNHLVVKPGEQAPGREGYQKPESRGQKTDGTTKNKCENGENG